VQDAPPNLLGSHAGVEPEDASHRVCEMRSARGRHENAAMTREPREEPWKIREVLVEPPNQVRRSIRRTHARDDGSPPNPAVDSCGHSLIENRKHPRRTGRKQARGQFAIQRLGNRVDELELAVPVPRLPLARERSSADSLQQHIPRQQNAAPGRTQMVAHPGAEVPIGMERHEPTAACGFPRLQSAERECFNQLTLEASTEVILTWDCEARLPSELEVAPEHAGWNDGRRKRDECACTELAESQRWRGHVTGGPHSDRAPDGRSLATDVADWRIGRRDYAKSNA
jgi:hypothetical protein